MYRTITRILGVGVFAISSVCTHAFGSVTGCLKYDKSSSHRWYPTSPVMGSFGSPVYSSDDSRKTQLTTYGEYLIPYDVLPENIGSCTGTGMVYDYDENDPCKWSQYCEGYNSWWHAYVSDAFKYGGVDYKVGNVSLGRCTPNGVQITSGDLMNAYLSGCTTGIAPSGCWFIPFNNCGFGGMVDAGYHCCIVDARCDFGYYMTGTVPSGVLLEPYDDFCQKCPSAGSDWSVTSKRELVGITSCRIKYVGSGIKDNTGTYTYDGLCNYVQ